MGQTPFFAALYVSFWQFLGVIMTMILHEKIRQAEKLFPETFGRITLFAYFCSHV